MNSSFPNLFNSYLFLIESNMSSQLLILCIKMGLLNGYGKLYFQWQDVSLLRQNCPKTCGFTLKLQFILEIIVITKTWEKPCQSFTGSKPNLNKTHIFGTTCFCYLRNKTKLDPRREKGIFIGYNKVQLTWFIFRKQQLLKELGV